MLFECNIKLYTCPLTQDRSSLVDLVCCQSTANGPERTPDKTLGVVRNLDVRNGVECPNCEPSRDECCQTCRIAGDDFPSKARCGGALSDDASQDGGGEERHLLDVVGLCIFGALILLEARHEVLANSQAIILELYLHRIGYLALDGVW